MVTPLRVVFFGTPEFAVPTLAALLGSSHQVVGVVTQPDRKRGRGQHVAPEAVKRLATEQNLPTLQPLRLGDESFLTALQEMKPDLGVVVAYGRILTPRVLALPRLGLINVHASLLPRWRGAAPIHRAILAGDDHTGVTIMRVVQALDADQPRRPLDAIGATRPAPSCPRLSRDGAGLLVETVDALALGHAADAAGRGTRYLCDASREAREPARLGAAGSGRAQPDPRSAAVADDECPARRYTRHVRSIASRIAGTRRVGARDHR
jgi:methionyl-tRNA formyltransferase